MAVLNFPASPTLNQIYTANGKSWRWDGGSWVALIPSYDGDKGEITVSDAGAVWTLDNGVVTTAKIADANVTTAKIADANVTTAKLGGDITAAGKALLDDADAATQRSTLGLGTMATQNSSSINITGGTISSATITGGTISGATINPSPGDSIVSARALSAPSYIGTAGTYLKADYPQIGSLANLALNGTSWTGEYIPYSESSYVMAVAYGNGVWIAAGSFGTILRSTDGVNWTYVSYGGATINSIAYGNGVWIASANTVIYRSTDNGLTWVSSTKPTASGGAGPIATDGAGTWVILAMGSTNEAARSTNDGVSWTSGLLWNGGSPESILYANGRWLATGQSGGMKYSTNAFVSYVNCTYTTTGYFSGLAYGGSGVWCAGNSEGKIFRSTDNGVTFTTATTPSLGACRFTAIGTDGSGTWIAFANNAATAANNGVMLKSTDNGVTWVQTSATPVGATTSFSIGYAGGRWCVAAYVLATSTDAGVNWSLIPTRSDGNSGGMAYGGGTIISLQPNTNVRTRNYARSTDGGSTWSLLLAPSTISGVGTVTAYYDVSYGNGVWILVASAPVAAPKLARSTDGGLTWPTTYYNGTLYMNTTPVAGANGVWIAGSGNSNSVIRSTDNGLTWSQVSASVNYLKRIGSDGGSVFIGSSQSTTTSQSFYRTSDGGLTWSDISAAVNIIPGSGGGNIKSIAYSGGVWVIVSFSSPYVRYSSDGGLTWLTPSGSLPSSLTAACGDGTGTWILAGSGSTIYRSLDGAATFSTLSTSLSAGNTVASIIFDGTNFIIAGDASASLGTASPTQFLVKSTYASSLINRRYLYTGQ